MPPSAGSCVICPWRCVSRAGSVEVHHGCVVASLLREIFLIRSQTLGRLHTEVEKSTRRTHLMVLLFAVGADVVRLRIFRIRHILEPHAWRARELIGRGGAERLPVRHSCTHHARRPDAGNSGTDSGHLSSLEGHNYSPFHPLIVGGLNHMQFAATRPGCPRVVSAHWTSTGSRGSRRSTLSP